MQTVTQNFFLIYIKLEMNAAHPLNTFFLHGFCDVQANAKRDVNELFCTFNIHHNSNLEKVQKHSNIIEFVKQTGEKSTQKYKTDIQFIIREVISANVISIQIKLTHFHVSLQADNKTFTANFYVTARFMDKQTSTETKCLQMKKFKHITHLNQCLTMQSVSHTETSTKASVSELFACGATCSRNFIIQLIYSKPFALNKQ